MADRYIQEALFRDPHSLSDQDLLKISLSTLSKGLDPTLSPRKTMKMYLRWLEMHRQNVSSLTQVWHNALMQWIQSLRARGFSKSEIIEDVNRWKTENSSFPFSFGRHPPGVGDITKAFNNDDMGKRDDGNNKRPDRLRASGVSPRSGWPYETSRSNKYKPSEEDFERTPPGNYICSRCHTKGHFLQVCPTNLDPSFDRPPPSDYLCHLCELSGDHWKSLCPQNADPNSIIQKRKRRGIITPEPRSAILDDWEIGIKKQKESRRIFDREFREPSPNSKKEVMVKLEENENMRERVRRGESVDIDLIGKMTIAGNQQTTRKRARSGTTGEGSPTPRRQVKRQVMCDSDDESHYFRKIQPDEFMMDVDVKNEDEINVGMEDDEVEEPRTIKRVTFTPSKNISEALQKLTPRPRRLSRGSATSDDDDIVTPENMEDDQFCSPAIREDSPNPVYSDFVQRLIASRAEMAQIINITRRRPTALEMWDEDESRRLLRLSVSTPQTSPPSSPPSSPLMNRIEHDFPLERQSFVLLAHSEQKHPSPSNSGHSNDLAAFQMDGVCEEKPVQALNKLPNGAHFYEKNCVIMRHNVRNRETLLMEN